MADSPLDMALLKHVYNACDPFRAASADYYRDCSDARGSRAFIEGFVRHLELAHDTVCALFTGHIGCGKSSELRALERHVGQRFVGDKRYFPIFVDAVEYLDEYDVDLPDLLLAIVTEVARALREQAGIELEDSFITSRLQSVKNLLLADVDFKEAEHSFFGIKAKILKRDATARNGVREALRPHPVRLLEEINSLLGTARESLRKEEKAEDVLLIVDGLEKMRRFSGLDDGLKSHYELFIERAPQLTGLDVHTVYTVPLSLARAHGPELSARYDREPFVLPMVKVAERATKKPYAQGIAGVREILALRVAPSPLARVFTEEALDFLITYSGGNLRHLLQFVQEACTRTQTLPMPLTAAHQAIHGMVKIYSTAIDDSHWAKLARLERSSSQSIKNGDPSYLHLLDQQAVLEYINGHGGGPFEEIEPWYAVHPVVRELRRFKDALAAQGDGE